MVATICDLPHRLGLRWLDTFRIMHSLHRLISHAVIKRASLRVFKLGFTMLLKDYEYILTLPVQRDQYDYPGAPSHEVGSAPVEVTHNAIAR